MIAVASETSSVSVFRLSQDTIFSRLVPEYHRYSAGETTLNNEESCDATCALPLDQRITMRLQVHVIELGVCWQSGQWVTGLIPALKTNTKLVFLWHS